MSFYEQKTQTRNAQIPVESFPLEKRRITRNILLDPCRRIHNVQGFSASNIRDADADAGKYYYIHLDSYDTSPTTINIIDEVSRLLVNPAEFEPGAYYTYIISAVIGKNIQTDKIEILSHTKKPEIYVARTINMFEFGTKHHQIMYRKAIQDEALFAELSKSYKNIQYRIYASGEIMCVNSDTLIYNFISGTYKMKKHMTPTRIIYEKAYFTYMMRNMAPTYTNIAFQKQALITDEVLPLTKEELSRLRNRGVQYYLFDTPNKCNQMRNWFIQHANSRNFSKEEIAEIYRSIYSLTYSSPA
jgi:hypothetical protein